MMKKIISIGCMVIAIILMCTPYGVTRIFALNATETQTEHFSFFSTVPLRYGNFLPMITAVLSIGILILLIVGIKKNTIKAVSVSTGVAVLTSVLSWQLFNTYSIVWLSITLLYFFILVLQNALLKIELTKK